MGLFAVSVASVVTWSQRQRRTGSVRPDRIRDWLLARIADGRPLTLRCLGGELARRGLSADYRQAWNVMDVARATAGLMPDRMDQLVAVLDDVVLLKVFVARFPVS